MNLKNLFYEIVDHIITQYVRHGFAQNVLLKPILAQNRTIAHRFARFTTVALVVSMNNAGFSGARLAAIRKSTLATNNLSSK